MIADQMSAPQERFWGSRGGAGSRGIQGTSGGHCLIPEITRMYYVDSVLGWVERREPGLSRSQHTFQGWAGGPCYILMHAFEKNRYDREFVSVKVSFYRSDNCMAQPFA